VSSTKLREESLRRPGRQISTNMGTSERMGSHKMKYPKFKRNPMKTKMKICPGFSTSIQALFCKQKALKFKKSMTVPSTSSIALPTITLTQTLSPR